MKHFYHDDQTVRQMFDARINSSTSVAESDVFYTGYRVKIGNAQWFHHAVLLADSADALVGGSAMLVEQIRAELGFDAEIIPVFMRSLMTEDPDVIDSAYRCDIAQEIEASLADRKDDRYLVFGIVGDSQIALMNIAGGSAAEALIAAKVATHEQHGKPFFPLDVCQAHQVTGEFATKFSAAARRIRSLLGSSVVSLH